MFPDLFSLPCSLHFLLPLLPSLPPCNLSFLPQALVKRVSEDKSGSPVSPHERTLFYDSHSRRKAKRRKGKVDGKEKADERVRGKLREKRKRFVRRSSFPTLPTLRIVHQIKVSVVSCAYENL